jgi:hypothetical protein
MNVKVKIWMLLVAAGLMQHQTFSQTSVPMEMICTNLHPAADAILLSHTNANKKLPEGYQQEALIALSYFPELENVPVKFRVKKSFATLKTRPTFLSMFMPKGHRAYVITISNKTIEKLMPLIAENLPEDARVGIIGHELGHVVDFSKKSMWQSFKTAFAHLNKHYMDSLEFNTDKICIEHGLGKELEAWSSYIRNTMHTTYWRGADFVNEIDTSYERYMNPATIEKYMDEDRIQTKQTIINTR